MGDGEDVVMMGEGQLRGIVVDKVGKKKWKWLFSQLRGAQVCLNALVVSRYVGWGWGACAKPATKHALRRDQTREECRWLTLVSQLYTALLHQMRHSKALQPSFVYWRRWLRVKEGRCRVVGGVHTTVNPRLTCFLSGFRVARCGAAGRKQKALKAAAQK